MLFNLFNSIKISYGITVCNEAAELDRLLKALIPLIDKRDELIILQDVTAVNTAVNAVIEKYKKRIVLIEARLNSDFASFKNILVAKASGDYLFQIDADEVPERALIKKIKKVLKKRAEHDCFLIPRINIVNGLTPQHIAQWGWNVDEKNRVNFPDYQFRLFKLNSQIKWKNKVHEELYGYSSCFYLPVKNDDYCLHHIKNIARQEKQNEFYNTIPGTDK
jgi:glycosyltransferase involved in cell wall biosynthesis